MTATNDDQPIDVAALRADEQLINRIAAREHQPTNRLERMLDALVSEARS